MFISGQAVFLGGNSQVFLLVHVDQRSSYGDPQWKFWGVMEHVDQRSSCVDPWWKLWGVYVGMC